MREVEDLIKADAIKFPPLGYRLGGMDLAESCKEEPKPKIEELLVQEDHGALVDTLNGQIEIGNTHEIEMKLGDFLDLCCRLRNLAGAFIELTFGKLKRGIECLGH